MCVHVRPIYFKQIRNRCFDTTENSDIVNLCGIVQPVLGTPSVSFLRMSLVTKRYIRKNGNVWPLHVYQIFLDYIVAYHVASMCIFDIRPDDIVRNLQVRGEPTCNTSPQIARTSISFRLSCSTNCNLLNLVSCSGQQNRATYQPICRRVILHHTRTGQCWFIYKKGQQTETTRNRSLSALVL